MPRSGPSPSKLEVLSAYRKECCGGHRPLLPNVAHEPEESTRKVGTVNGGHPDFEFTVKYAPGRDLVVTGTLSRDSVEEPLCAGWFREIKDPKTGDGTVEAVNALVSFSGVGGGSTPEDIRTKQRVKLGDIKDCTEQRHKSGYLLDKSGLLRRKRTEGS